MAKARAKHGPLPGRKAVLDFIAKSREAPGRRQVMRAFPVRGADRAALKILIDELEDEGLIGGRRAPPPKSAGGLPPVAVVEVTGVDLDGEVMARPQNWRGEGEAPSIYLAAPGRGLRAPGEGDRVLVRLRRQEDGTYEAEPIRRLTRAPARVLGVYRTGGQGARVQPTDRRLKKEIEIPRGEGGAAMPGDLVLVETTGRARVGLPQGRVVEVLGPADGPGAISLIAIHTHGIPVDFPEGALAQAAAARPVSAEGRHDIRDLPLVTIDGADARDFDDAVLAEPDPERPGGWRLVVAIADVSFYVRPGDALDQAALERGNSVYFPDRVVPMLPEALSNGWCSLVPHEDRPCMAAHLWIDAEGTLTRHKFRRGVMRSNARLTYNQVQAARDGKSDAITEPLMASVINPLYGAYAALLKNRSKRGVLELDMPERKVEVDTEGNVEAISVRQRLDSHKLIEEFMICANVAAAETLEKAKMPCLYRVHDEPAQEKLAGLREVLSSVNISFEKGGVATPKRFNRVLKLAAGTPHAEMVNFMVLRSQAQAEYAPGNLGHFGLALRRYSHFTSPIRRYADLLVHRALIDAGRLGEGGLGKSHPDLVEAGEHLSDTERRAAGAERDAVDRFTAAYLADRIGGQFSGRINGVTRFGLFITLHETGADGLVPIRTLPDDYYVHDEGRHSLRGRRTRREYQLGKSVDIRLVEASPVTGGMIFKLMEPGETRGSPGGSGKKAKSARGKKGRSAK